MALGDLSEHASMTLTRQVDVNCPKVLLAIALIVAACAPQVTARHDSTQRERCAPPPNLQDGWEISRPGDVGMDSERLCAINAKVVSGALGNIHSVLVVRRGKLVFEQYFSGKDERFGTNLGVVDFKPTTLHDIRSISKTVTSLLFGIAIGEGKIPGVTTQVVEYYPEYSARMAPGLRAIRLEHLLTMTMGLEWDEESVSYDSLNSERQMDDAPDHRGFVLTRPIVAAPGEKFAYSGGATMLLSGVLEKATGVPIDQYARRVLFDPLGIREFDWIKFHNGDVIAHAGLRLTPRSLAKIGSLFLDQGKWNDRQIVSGEWIRQSVQSRAQANPGFEYGYQLWLGSTKADERKVAWIAAAGNGMQRIFVIPSIDVLVIITAGAYHDQGQQVVAMRIIDENVLPAITDWTRHN
jgi:CubicO group peptidase (beta-lactamase class C family)